MGIFESNKPIGIKKIWSFFASPNLRHRISFRFGTSENNQIKEIVQSYLHGKYALFRFDEGGKLIKRSYGSVFYELYSKMASMVRRMNYYTALEILFNKYDHLQYYTEEQVIRLGLNKTSEVNNEYTNNYNDNRQIKSYNIQNDNRKLELPRDEHPKKIQQRNSDVYLPTHMKESPRGEKRR